MIMPLLLGVAATLPLGPAGHSIMENTMGKGVKHGLRSFVELQIVELFYLLIGLIFFSSIKDNSYLHYGLNVVGTLFLFVFGILVLKESLEKSEYTYAKLRSTWVWALFNPGILLLYISVVTYFKGDTQTLFYFQLGSILAILGLIYIVAIKRELLLNNLQLIKKIVGLLFIILSCVKTFLLLN